MEQAKPAAQLVERPALIVVKRVYFGQFASGEKTKEYRRHRPPFTERTFYPGRLVRIAYNYQLGRFPFLLARVTRFEISAASDYPAILAVHPFLDPSEEIAVIGLAVQR
jgi:hypothetical protein